MHTCKQKDIAGICHLHNLHCNYPACETGKPDIDGNTKNPTNKRSVPAVVNPWNLSPMEFMCLRRYSEGKELNEIAKELCLSVKTVGTYVGRARQKMTPPSEAKDLSSTRCAILIDRFLREGMDAPSQFAVLVEMKNGVTTSRVVDDQARKAA